MDYPIQVRGLRKAYGDFEAVRGIDFEVSAGEVFGLLGPNGAGKTTTVEILEGLRQRDDGKVSVLGYDPSAQNQALKGHIGVALQATNLPDKITVREALELFASFYPQTQHIPTLLERLQMWDHRDKYYQVLSGGQKQRLALAMALLHDPQVIFLDEPSAGLDPQARHEIHRLVEELRDEQRTILITTHYIEEAERLCDRVAIMDHGRIVIQGTPDQLREKTFGRTVIEVTCSAPIPNGDLPSLPEDENGYLSPDRKCFNVASANPAKTLIDIVRWIDENGLDLSDVQLKKPSLEDVFLELTGRRLRE